MTTKGDVNTAAASSSKWLRGKQKEHIALVEGAIKNLQDEILDSLHLLSVATNGSVEGIKTNMRNAQKLHTMIEGLYQTEFTDKTRKMITSFNKAKTDIRQNFSLIGESARFTSVDEDMMKVLRDGYYSDYLVVSEQSKRRVTQAMYNTIIGRGKFQELSNQIRGALLGSGAVNAQGRSLAQYSRLYAKDQIMNYHNELMMLKAETAGMEYFLYTGTIMSSSRKFCIQRVGNTYSRKEIESWRFKWKGKSGPAMTHRGGYNCRHHWQPVKPDWLTEDDQKGIDQLSSIKDGEVVKPWLG